MRQNKSFHIALCGVLGAVSCVLLMGAGLFPLMDLSLAGAAGLVLLPIIAELGCKWAMSVYAVVCVLGVLLVPNKEPVVLFVFVLGYYPVLKFVIDKRIKNRAFGLVLKILAVNGGVAVSYFLMLQVLGLTYVKSDFATMSTGILIAVFVLYNVSALVYDIALNKLWVLYLRQIAPKLKSAVRR